MYKIGLVAALAATCFAMPAVAGEVRIEARGGVVWAAGEEEATAGVALGYDFDLSDDFFVGVEGTADKVLASDVDFVFGTNVRAGVKIGEKAKIYALAGYGFDELDAFQAGGGVQLNLGKRAYVKAEYRRYFESFVDINSASAGIGVRF